MNRTNIYCNNGKPKFQLKLMKLAFVKNVKIRTPILEKQLGEID